MFMIQIEVAERKEQDIPPGWGCDAEGNTSTDPTQVLATGGLYPLGGPEETSM